MQDTEKLQIYIMLDDGSMRSWGYDGRWFDTYEKVLDDVAKDFPDSFPETYPNTESMLLVWGEGLPIANELDGVPTKTIAPTFGAGLVAEVSSWLTEIGVLA